MIIVFGALGLMFPFSITSADTTELKDHPMRIAEMQDLRSLSPGTHSQCTIEADNAVRQPHC